MVKCNALRRNHDNNEKRLKANRTWKWKHILKSICEEKDLYTGNGIGGNIPTIILPSDPNALLERFDLLMASKAAVNTGVGNELVTICDELLRQKIFYQSAYKKNYVTLIKMLVTKRTYNKQYVVGGADIFDFYWEVFCKIIFDIVMVFFILSGSFLRDYFLVTQQNNSRSSKTVERL